MPMPLPEFIDPIRFANQGQEVVGSYPLAALGRLASSLHQTDGTVDFQLRFATTGGRRVVSGRIATRLCLLCQRCLAPFWYPIERDVHLAMVTDLAVADQLPSEMEPLLVNGMMSVRETVEDELLLALPVVATHELEQCPARNVLEQYAPVGDDVRKGKRNPFAILKPT